MGGPFLVLLYTGTRTMFTTTIDNADLGVSIIIEGNVISFEVGGSYDKVANTKKIAITKWLLKEFKKLKETKTMLRCVPYEGDGHGEYRTAVYTKLGFISIPDHYEMFWCSTVEKMEVVLSDFAKVKTTVPVLPTTPVAPVVYVATPVTPLWKQILFYKVW